MLTHGVIYVELERCFAFQMCGSITLHIGSTSIRRVHTQKKGEKHRPLFESLLSGVYSARRLLYALVRLFTAYLLTWNFYFWDAVNNEPF